MSRFPPDIISNILCRLPVKPLLRFRCVSKELCSLIDSPDFIKLHLNHSLKTNTNLSLILSGISLHSIYRDLFSIDLDTLDKAVKLNHPVEDRGGSLVLGSCNGLLALCNSDEDIALCNPYTKKYQKLPITEIEFQRSCSTVGWTSYGFGYDPVSDDYKFVSLVQFHGTHFFSIKSEVKVYSLKTNSWRRIRDFPYHLFYERSYGVLANNALHWVVTRLMKMVNTRNLVIAAFDLRTEEYFEVPQPDYGDKDKDSFLSIGVLGGCLYVFYNYLKVCIDIWVMKEYRVKESWIKLFSVAHKEVIGEGSKYVRPLAYSKNGDKFLFFQGYERFVWYDLGRKTAEKVRTQGAPESFDVEMCVASLVPLSGWNGTNSTKQQAPMKKNKKSGKKRDDFLSHGFKLVL